MNIVFKNRLLFLLAFLLCAMLQYNSFANNNFEFLLYYEKGDSVKAVNLHKQALLKYKNRLFEDASRIALGSLANNVGTSNKKLNAENYLLLGRIFRKSGQIPVSLKYYLKGINIYKSIGDINKQAITNFEIAMLYIHDDGFVKAIEYLQPNVELISGVNKQVVLPELYSIKEVLENIQIDFFLEQNDFISLNNEMLGKAYLLSEEFGKAIEVYKELETHYRNISQWQLESIASNNLAKSYSNNRDYTLAISKYKELNKLYNSHYAIEGVASTMNNIGINYYHLQDFNNAIKSFKVVLGADDAMNSNGNEYAKALNNMAICYQNIGDYIEAISLFNKALKVYATNTDTLNMALVNYKLTLTYFYKDDIYNAEVYCIEAMQLANSSRNAELIQKTYQTYSEILKYGNDPDLALDYYKRYLSIRDSIAFEKRLAEQIRTQKQYEAEKAEKELKLSLADEEMKDLALKQQQLEIEKRAKENELLWREKELLASEAKKKELEQERTLQQLELIKQQKEATERDHQIGLLEREKERQELELEKNKMLEEKRRQEIDFKNAELDKKELEIEKNAIEKRQSQTMFIFLALISVLILGGLILTSRKNKILDRQKNEIHAQNVDLAQKNEEINTQKEHLEQANKDISNKNEEITTQSELLAKKNKDITSSINYASRIQGAIMPPENIIADAFAEHFVFFKPRDLVSGDFYWMKQVGDKTIIAAADCTGHGVPGALMSMLGISFLNELVTFEKVPPANIILNGLRTRVKAMLRQTDKSSDSKDGMDIALCIYDKSNITVEYAGAYNPLYLIRDGEILETKADKMPIGVYIREKETFTNNIIQLRQGDTMYIFSDGYIDQFGGPRIEKFKIRPFKNLLLSIQNKSMATQKNILTHEFEKWRGDYEQIDDVLLIGMRV